MIIYIDQMFLENFIMNYIIIYLTSKFSGVSGRWYRFSFGASLGAIYVILSYILGFYNEAFIIPKILLSVIMILSAFKFSAIKDFFKVLIFFYTVTFFIGGVSFGLAYFLNASIIKEGGVLYVEEFPILMILIGTIFSIIFGRWIIKILDNRIRMDKFLYDIYIEVMGKSLSTVVLMDSGNELKDPITKKPVLVIENDLLKSIIPESVIGKILKNDFELEEVWKKRIRIISISTINSEEKLNIGFKLDKCVILTKTGEKYFKDMIVVGCDKVLSKEKKYHALIGNVV